MFQKLEDEYMKLKDEINDENVSRFLKQKTSSPSENLGTDECSCWS